MQLKLSLSILQKAPLLTFNYQYPFSAAIYKIIQRADEGYASFLHDTGYQKAGSLKSFKLFTFSEIKTPFTITPQGLRLLSDTAELVVCFHLPKAAETFIKGLFIHQQIEIADRKSKTVFTITGVELLPSGIISGEKVLLQPLSPIVAGRKNSRGHYEYRSPEDENFCECLYYNWMEKCAVAGVPVMAGGEEPEVSVEVIFFNHPPQQRLIAIKAGTEAETKIRGYTKFRLAVTAPPEMIELALGAGLGLHNAQGVGCVAQVKTG